MVKPNIEESLSLLHDSLLQSLAHKFDLGVLSEEDQVTKSLKSGNAVKLGNLSDWALSQLRQIMSLLLCVRKDIFNNLLHEDAVVSLCGHTRV